MSMNTFKTKYKLVSNTIDVLPFIRHSNDAVSIDKNLKMKEANYTVSTTKAVSSSKVVNLSVKRLSGKGVNKNTNIYHEYDCINGLSDLNTSFGRLDKSYKRRMFKSKNIVYDLLN